MDPNPDLQVLEAGRLLVANPLLPDPNFDRTVVLLLAFGTDGAVGVVLNRPSGTGVGTPLPRWEALAAAPAVVFVGGPVQHQAVICLARPAGAPAGPGWKQVTGDVGTLDLDMDPAALAGEYHEVRVFAGYAGWGAGQLEAEIEAGAWWVVDAEPADAFCADPDDLWKQVLRRQPVPLSFVAWFPDDPTWN